MIRSDSANPTIILDAETGECSFELINHLIDVLPHRESLCFRGALDIDSVLVCSGQKKRVDTSLSLELRKRIDNQGGVSVTKVRLRVDVVDWSGNVEGVFSHVEYQS